MVTEEDIWNANGHYCRVTDIDGNVYEGKAGYNEADEDDVKNLPAIDLGSPGNIYRFIDEIVKLEILR